MWEGMRFTKIDGNFSKEDNVIVLIYDCLALYTFDRKQESAATAAVCTKCAISHFAPLRK